MAVLVLVAVLVNLILIVATYSDRTVCLCAQAFMYIPLVGQGVAYSIYAAALWPSVQATVDQVRQQSPLKSPPTFRDCLGHLTGGVLADVSSGFGVAE